MTRFHREFAQFEAYDGWMSTFEAAYLDREGDVNVVELAKNVTDELGYSPFGHFVRAATCPN